MNKFLKLTEINKDIELLESAGLFKAADVLHKKFIRVAQEFDPAKITTMLDQYKDMPANILDGNGMYVSPDLKTYDDNGDLIPFFNGDDFETLLKTGKLEKNGETYTYDFKKPLNTTAPTNAPTNAPVNAPTNAPTNAPVNAPVTPPVTPPVKENKIDYTKYYSPPVFKLEDFESEGALYNAALLKIKQEFLELDGDRTLGEKVYTDTIVQFSNSKIKQQFANQVQNLRTKAFRRDPKIPLFNQER